MLAAIAVCRRAAATGGVEGALRRPAVVVGVGRVLRRGRAHCPVVTVMLIRHGLVIVAGIGRVAAKVVRFLAVLFFVRRHCGVANKGVIAA